jgi:pSer/pThr/pTyr-binding forkhead associated (FHA) protein
MSSNQDRPDFYDETVLNREDFIEAAQRITTKILDREVAETAQPNKNTDSLYVRPWRVSFYIPSSKVELVFEVNNSLYIGRSARAEQLFEGLDLSPFSGYEMGVSRLHAEISLKNEKVVIIDKGSSNGTLLNQQRLETNVAYILKHGDDISFGNMPVNVFFLTPIFEAG